VTTDAQEVFGQQGPPIGESIAVLGYHSAAIESIFNDETLQTREQILAHLMEAHHNFVMDMTQSYRPYPLQLRSWGVCMTELSEHTPKVSAALLDINRRKQEEKQ